MRLTGMCNLLKMTIHSSKPFKQSRIRKVNRARTHLCKMTICFVLMLIISVFCLTALKTNQFLSFGATYIDGKWFEKFKETLPEIQDNQRGNSSGNIANFGFFCMADGWIYYSTEEGLIKSLPNGNEKTIIKPGVRCYWLNVVDDWIFFVDENNSRIYRIRTDGSNYRRLVDQGCLYVQVIDDAIYYLDIRNQGIYKVDLDGKKQHLIVSTNTRFFLVKDGWVYYFSEYVPSHDYYVPGGIQKIRTDGSNERNIVNAEIASFYFDIADQCIYYNDINEGFSRVNMDGSKKEKIKNTHPSYFFNLFNRWIFACEIGGRLYRIDLNGSNQLLLDNREAIYPHVIGEWIYYTIFRRDTEAEAEWYRIKMDGTGKERIEGLPYCDSFVATQVDALHKQ